MLFVNPWSKSECFLLSSSDIGIILVDFKNFAYNLKGGHRIKTEGVINMGSKILSIPEDSLIAVLKTLPENELIEIFWKALVESDVSPLSHEEREEIKKGKMEFEKGETIKWENLK